MIRTLILVSTAALAVAGSAWAQDPDPGAAPSVSIRYTDLNLASDAGAGAMLSRIQAAASTACAGSPDTMMLGRRQIYEKCRRETVARAVAQLNAPTVTTLAGLSSPVRVASN